MYVSFVVDTIEHNQNWNDNETILSAQESLTIPYADVCVKIMYLWQRCISNGIPRSTVRWHYRSLPQLPRFGTHMCKNITQWGRVIHIWVSKLTIGSDNGLSPVRLQAIIWNNSGVLSIGDLRKKFNHILFEIQTFWFKKMYFKVLFANGGHFVSASMW